MIQASTEMDKVTKAAEILTLILISLACLAYIWRQYYDYERREEAWNICTTGRTTK
jgi:hypothetical protein